MSISVTIGFVFCWAPLFITTFVRTFSNSPYTWITGKTISILLVLSHSAINPFLYIIFSIRVIRASFTKLCQRANCCQHRQRGSCQEIFRVQGQLSQPSASCSNIDRVAEEHQRRRRVADAARAHHPHPHRDLTSPLEGRRVAEDTAPRNRRHDSGNRATWAAPTTSRQSWHSSRIRYGVDPTPSAPPYF